MNIHEYQAKELFRKYGIPVGAGEVAHNTEEAIEITKKLGGTIWVVKAQIHAGGRGKAGGVKLCKSKEEVRDYTNSLLGSTLVTHQTGPQGQIVRKVYVESAANVGRAFYLSFVLSRNASQTCIIASAEGGVEIRSEERV